MRERVSGDQQIEAFEHGSLAAEHRSQLTGLVPKVRGLLQLDAAVEERQHAGALRGTSDAAPQLGSNGSAHGDVIAPEQVVDGIRDGITSAEKVDPG